MSVLAEITETYRAPGRVVRRHLSRGVREDRALIILMAACLAMFLAQWPVLARAAHLDREIPLDARLGGAMLATVFLLPLVLYAVAGLSHIVARIFGGRGTYFGARIALFWAMLAIAPLALLRGLLAGVLGQSLLVGLVGLAVFCGFIVFWGAGLRVAEFEEAPVDAEISD